MPMLHFDCPRAAVQLIKREEKSWGRVGRSIDDHDDEYVEPSPALEDSMKPSLPRQRVRSDFETGFASTAENSVPSSEIA